jgi:hypothetical protein
MTGVCVVSYELLSPVSGLFLALSAEHERMIVGQWVRVEGDDGLRAIQSPFKPLQVRYFISSNSNLSHEVQYRDMKVKHVNKHSDGAWAVIGHA